MNKKNWDRYYILGGCYFLVMVVFLFRFYNLQITHGSEYDQISQRKLLKTSTILAARGNIFDRNNIPIALNRMGHSVEVVRAGLKASDLNEMIIKLINVFEENDDSYYNRLYGYLRIDPEIKYGPRLNSATAIERWKKDMVNEKEHLKDLKTSEDMFEYLRTTKFKVDDKYTKEEAYKIISVRYEMLINGYTAVNPIFLSRDVSKETVAQIAERYFEFPGVSTEVIPLRKYVNAEDEAHIIGYVSKINAEEYKDKKNKYGMNDLIGKSGIEKMEESELKGVNVRKRVFVDTNGRFTADYDGTPAQPGNDVILTIDVELQKTAMRSLKENIEIIKSKADNKVNFGDAFAGSVVALDVNSGEILAMANYPSYDPSIFIAGKDDKESQKKIIDLFQDDLNSPMLNRAVRGIYVPGSTFKPITAIAALEEGVITEKDTVYDNGLYTVGNITYECLEYRLGLGAHGRLNLERAMATSCNVYFYDVGVRTGIDNISKWTKLFGLGNKTGVDIPGEDKGRLGDRTYKNTEKKESWYPADTAQTSIGQLYNAFTPIQIAKYVATIANGGKRYTPFVVKQIVKYDGTLVMEKKSEFEQLPIKESTIKSVKKSMEAVVSSSEGTAYKSFKDFPIKIAGKTGTPETGNEAFKESSNGLFVCYAPVDDPKIAVVVVVERGVWGTYTAPIAKDILKQYFELNSKQIIEKEVMSEKIQFTH